MACDLTSGRTTPCKNSRGGLKTIYLADKGTINPTFFGKQITSLAGVWFKYDLVGTKNTYTDLSVSNRVTRTRFSDQTLNVVLPKLDKNSSTQLDRVLAGDPHIVIEDHNNNYFLMGIDNGCDTTVTMQTGGARGDLSGYTVIFKAFERLSANFLNDDLENIITGSISSVQIYGGLGYSEFSELFKIRVEADGGTFEDSICFQEAIDTI